MKNMSVDCDCCAKAEDPYERYWYSSKYRSSSYRIKLGLDLVYNSSDKGKDHLIERIESRQGTHIIDAAASIGFGNSNYELINID